MTYRNREQKADRKRSTLFPFSQMEDREKETLGPKWVAPKAGSHSSRHPTLLSTFFSRKTVEPYRAGAMPLHPGIPRVMDTLQTPNKESIFAECIQGCGHRGSFSFMIFPPKCFFTKIKAKATMLFHSVITIILGRIFFSFFIFYFNWRAEYFLLCLFYRQGNWGLGKYQLKIIQSLKTAKPEFRGGAVGR